MAVSKVAFVFHAKQFDTEFLDCAGMAHVFFTRYQLNHLDQLVAANFGSLYNMFHSNVYETYPCRIWWSILELKNHLTKLLNDCKQYQVCKKSVSINYPGKSWHFFQSHMREFDVVYFEFRRRYTSKSLHHNLTISSRSQKLLFNLLRIDSARSMEGARQMFGDTFGIGIKPPQIGDIVNIVNVDANNPLDDDAERYKELTFMQGVHFIYNESFQLLRIRARYSRVAAESPLISNVLGLNLSLPP
jgi:hypothetical protein